LIGITHDVELTRGEMITPAALWFRSPHGGPRWVVASMVSRSW
jgi:hypothetical protein